MSDKIQTWMEENGFTGIEVWKHSRREGVWCAIRKASRMLDPVWGEGESVEAAIDDLIEKTGGAPKNSAPPETDDQFEDLLG